MKELKVSEKVMELLREIDKNTLEVLIAEERGEDTFGLMMKGHEEASEIWRKVEKILGHTKPMFSDPKTSKPYLFIPDTKSEEEADEIIAKGIDYLKKLAKKIVKADDRKLAREQDLG